MLLEQILKDINMVKQVEERINKGIDLDIAWYDLQKTKKEILQQQDMDPQRTELLNEIAQAQIKLSEVNEKYESNLVWIEDQLNNIKQAWIKEYDGTSLVHLEYAVLKYRVTRSIEIKDTPKIVEWLTTNGKIQDGVAKLKLPFIRKLADVGVLPEDSYRYNEQINLTVSEVKEDDRCI